MFKDMFTYHKVTLRFFVSYITLYYIDFCLSSLFVCSHDVLMKPQRGGERCLGK